MLPDRRRYATGQFPAALQFRPVWHYVLYLRALWRFQPADRLRGWQFRVPAPFWRSGFHAQSADADVRLQGFSVRSVHGFPAQFRSLPYGVIQSNGSYAPDLRHRTRYRVRRIHVASDPDRSGKQTPVPDRFSAGLRSRPAVLSVQTGCAVRAVPPFPFLPPPNAGHQRIYLRSFLSVHPGPAYAHPEFVPRWQWHPHRV